MHNQHLELNHISKLGIIVLSIVLLTGISLVPILQIGVQAQGQQQQSPAPPSPSSPGGSPSSGTSPPPPPASSAAPSSPGGSPSSGTSPPPPPASSAAPSSPGGSPSSGTSPPPAVDAAGGGAVNQTSGGSSAVNQSAMVMIPQSSVMTILDNLETLMDAVADDEDAMMALESVDQELRSAANASGISIEITTDE